MALKVISSFFHSHSEEMVGMQSVRVVVASVAGGVIAADLVFAGLILAGLITLPFVWPVTVGVLGSIAVVSGVVGIAALIALFYNRHAPDTQPSNQNYVQVEGGGGGGGFLGIIRRSLPPQGDPQDSQPSNQNHVQVEGGEEGAGSPELSGDLPPLPPQGDPQDSQPSNQNHVQVEGGEGDSVFQELPDNQLPEGAGETYNRLEDSLYSFSRNRLEIKRSILKQKPIEILQKIQGTILDNHGFPQIQFEGMDAVDQGGPSREFISILFKEIYSNKLKFLEYERCFLPKIESESDSESFFAIGVLFGSILRKSDRKLVTPFHFHPLLFEMLFHCIDKKIFNVTDSSSSEKDGVEILSCYFRFISCVEPMVLAENYFAVKGEQGLLSNYYYQNMDEFLQVYPKADEIYQAIPAVLQIAEGMVSFYNRSNIESTRTGFHEIKSSKDLELAIAGTPITRNELLSAFQYEGASSPECSTANFLTQWISSEATDMKWILRLYFSATGSWSLLEGKKVRVKFIDPKKESLGGVEWFPHYNTCDQTITIPKEYKEYPEFKEKLEASIRQSIYYGFQSR